MVWKEKQKERHAPRLSRENHPWIQTRECPALYRGEHRGTLAKNTLLKCCQFYWQPLSATYIQKCGGSAMVSVKQRHHPTKLLGKVGQRSLNQPLCRCQCESGKSLRIFMVLLFYCTLFQVHSLACDWISVVSRVLFGSFGYDQSDPYSNFTT